MWTARYETPPVGQTGFVESLKLEAVSYRLEGSEFDYLCLMINDILEWTWSLGSMLCE
jgi:hypothetical protein